MAKRSGICCDADGAERPTDPGTDNRVADIANDPAHKVPAVSFAIGDPAAGENSFLDACPQCNISEGAGPTLNGFH